MDRCLRNKCVQVLISIVRWVPVLFITVVICWAYYAYVYQFCINNLTTNEQLQRIIYLIVFHILLIFFIWSYFQTVVTPIGAPPNLFLLPQHVREELGSAQNESDYRTILERFVRQQKVPITNRAFEGGVRFCLKCSCIKPDRSHHCSVCGHCVLKFDHHCPWVNTCVNFMNYKYFILFLGYGFCLCVFGFFSILPYFISFWQNSELSRATFGKFNVLFLFFVSGMFGISLGCLFFYHLYLTSRNLSTIESFRPPMFTYGVDKNGYNLGIKRNFQEVFGPNVLYWFIPIFTSMGDGVEYPQKFLAENSSSGNSAAGAYRSRDNSPPTQFLSEKPSNQVPGQTVVHASFSTSSGGVGKSLPLNWGDLWLILNAVALLFGHGNGLVFTIAEVSRERYSLLPLEEQWDLLLDQSDSSEEYSQGLDEQQISPHNLV